MLSAMLKWITYPYVLLKQIHYSTIYSLDYFSLVNFCSGDLQFSFLLVTNLFPVVQLSSQTPAC